MQPTIKVVTGLDIGNGYIKGVADVFSENKKIKTTHIDLPSCIASVASPIDIPPESVEAEVLNIFNRASLSFTTPSLKGS